MLLKVGIWTQAAFGHWLPNRNKVSIGRGGEERGPNSKKIHLTISARTHSGWRDLRWRVECGADLEAKQQS